MELGIEYKGWEIKYIEYDNSWSGKLGEISLTTSQGLSELKKKIDASLKKESKFKNMDVVIETRWGGGSEGPFNKVTITSVNDNDECWIRTAGGNREKLYKGAVIYADNKCNWDIIAEMALKREAMKVLDQERDKLQESLEKLNIPGKD